MSSHNECTLMGRLGKDPELRFMPDGKAVANFSLCTDRGKNKTTGVELPPDWHQISLFGKTAETAGEYLKKGSLCLIVGRIHYEKWDDPQTGQTKYATKIHGHVLRLISSPKDGSAVQPADPPPTGAQQAVPENPFPDQLPVDEDVPF